jgi:glutathione S-transferase
MLGAAGVEFDDIYFKDRKCFTTLTEEKGLLTWGQVPLLKIDGVALTQSMACVRYVARKYNLYGKGNKQAAYCDILGDGIREFLGVFTGIAFVAEEGGARKGRLAAIQLHSLPKYLPRIEAALAKSAAETDSKCFLPSSRLAYPDITVQEIYDYVLEWFGATALDAYPNILAHREHVRNVPNVKAFLASKHRHPLQDAPYVKHVNEVLGR